MGDAAVRGGLILLALILAGATILQTAKSRRLAAELENSAAAHTRERDALSEEVAALERRLREREDALRRSETDAETLRIRLAELSARIGELEAALAAEAAPADEPEPVVALSSEESAIIEIAAVEAAEIAAASQVPFVEFEDLPPEYQEVLEPVRGRALFVRYPPNRWGEDGFIVVKVGVMDEGAWTWLPLDPYSQPLFRRIAELSYLDYVAEEERIDLLIRKGEGEWYPDRRSAEADLGSLMVHHADGGQTGGWLRMDPESGETWICRGTLVQDSWRMKKLREQRSLLGSLLTAGRTASISYGHIRK